MQRTTQTMERALVSAVVLWWMATVAWSQSLTWLGILPGYSRSEAYGVSADGSVVVGWVSNAAGHWRAFRWVAGVGMQNLGLLSSESGSWNKESEAYGVSADGGIVVGWSYNDFGRPRALRWTASSKQDLGTLAGNSDLYSSKAYGVSADGRVVVGWSVNSAGNVRAFRWTADSGLQELGTLGGSVSFATGVSADGRVVVGEAHNGVRGASGSRAFRWTASGGMEDLNITYASLLTNGSVLLAARAISPNGRYIVGYGYNAATGRYEAFLLDVGTSR
jgi:probable HAF family extracellular repeat protein